MTAIETRPLQIGAPVTIANLAMYLLRRDREPLVGALVLDGRVVQLCALRDAPETAGAREGPAPSSTRLPQRPKPH